MGENKRLTTFQYLAQDSDNEYQIIDAIIVRVYQSSLGAISGAKKTNVLVKV
jgi:hypothetical protein